MRISLHRICGSAQTTTITVMITIPMPAKIAYADVCFGPSRLKAPMARMETMAQRPALRQLQELARAEVERHVDLVRERVHEEHVELRALAERRQPRASVAHGHVRSARLRTGQIEVLPGERDDLPLACGLVHGAPGFGFELSDLLHDAGALVELVEDAAIDAPDGAAQGVLVGEVADAITRRFKAETPIYIDVATERRYPG